MEEVKLTHGEAIMLHTIILSAQEDLEWTKQHFETPEQDVEEMKKLEVFLSGIKEKLEKAIPSLKENTLPDVSDEELDQYKPKEDESRGGSDN